MGGGDGEGTRRRRKIWFTVGEVAVHVDQQRGLAGGETLDGAGHGGRAARGLLLKGQNARGFAGQDAHGLDGHISLLP